MNITTRKIIAGLSIWAFACHAFANQLAVVDAQKIVYPQGARNAISITFDDARATQLSHGFPILERHNVKATFYVVPKFVETNLEGWKGVVKAGHEIGNHTSSHLCTGNFQWLRDLNAGLEQVDLAWLEQDIQKATQSLKAQLGTDIKSFAYPCGQTFVGRGSEVKSYVPLVAKHFETGRRWMDETGNNPGYVDFAQLTSLPMDGRTYEQIIEMIEYFRMNNAWIILAGHEVGQLAQYSTDTEVLEKLLAYLNDPKNGYWVAPVSKVAAVIKAQREVKTE